MQPLSETTILSTLEQLVDDGIITHEPYEVIEEDHEGYPVEFRICPSLSRKPQKVGAPLEPPFNKSRKWGPGSDMYCPDERLILAQLNNTHDLALNLFCVDKPQLILLTLDSYQRQHQPLDRDDFAAALEVLRRLGNMYIIYNCTETAGCSRMHKHMQGLRGPPRAFDLFVQDPENATSTVPFRYFVHRFDQGFRGTSAADLVGIYGSLLGCARRVSGLSDADDVCPHNVVLWRDTMIVIPRRNACQERASANAAGMLGSVWVAQRDIVDNWMQLGVRNVLQQLGVPHSV
ncbi:hypothetical protein BDV28DRAFT_136013 [Aspergillus coremiiformis]|uniref:Uncharacterized protein n=1 Tax=Aspergillus coremiiformis TaxID=138285 RepID=A0A5N6Z2S8_9EURO|nr:hypothetical protein BDV28DRAFT_136013 [Aspergillus coremiiformis]